MENRINFVDIVNFKSIQSCRIDGCKQINLFIGRPNVGKSNIIEALSLFSMPYLLENRNRKLSNFLRIENEVELFHNGNKHKNSQIETNIGTCKLEFDIKEGLRAKIKFLSSSFNVRIDEKLIVKGLRKLNLSEALIKRYNFVKDVQYKKSHSKYLIPPYGTNLLTIIENYPTLKAQVISFFTENNLEIVFDKSSQSIKIIQRNGNDVFLIPYNSIADMLQRLIFYMAAILSNNNSILLFEEPEAHSFPPYMSHFIQEMIYKNDNQYFVATHSPFVLNDLVENSIENLAVYIVYFEDNQTKVKNLTKDDLHSVLQDGVDLFTNSESFI
jgi:AAA15 family ATPase/GTPase